MAHLRAYYWNDGDMLRWERQRYNKLEKYIESINQKSMHGLMHIFGDYKNKRLVRRKQRKYSIKESN